MFQAILYFECYIVIERLIQDNPFSKNMIVTSQFVTPINGNHRTENVTKYPAKKKIPLKWTDSWGDYHCIWSCYFTFEFAFMPKYITWSIKSTKYIKHNQW